MFAARMEGYRPKTTPTAAEMVNLRTRERTQGFPAMVVWLTMCATSVMIQVTGDASRGEAMAAEVATVEADDLKKVVALLGGKRVLGRRLTTTLDAHNLIRQGLPSGALLHLIGSLGALRDEPSMVGALGMSVRTVQRRKEKPGKPLSQAQGGRTWKFAEILALAIRVFGSQRDAELWLESSIGALGHQRPIDLLATPAGTKLVEDFLVRLEYGVYT